ncbi:hypothetical protein A2917_00375 [Candidatus Nomurabacteria bacterium RIFCSPLOWO2_01_FULL_42_17]|uniref:DUF3105 domain-containing protein n=1 Tax=Candidatus Nomurabacteria bacterium RIFCSPLOWO2_01_FULL_42_17 TaxID=1801780 RepID=A0A1F6XNN4_9BACT|nr:MAG: hypothetical protein A2917_00375 [Candidatus Nomurabacteria bacterium RIFCSPLOWO2_01_FULL_42_17]
MKKFIIILIIAFVSIGLIIWLTSIQDAKYVNYRVGKNVQNLESIGQEFENQGQVHIKNGESHPSYNSNPPTSGWHYVLPANWGVYGRPLADEQAIHNLEHGGIWITYKDIDSDTKENLEKITKANGGNIILSPRDANDSKIVLASWTRLEKLDSYDEAKILEFILRNRGKGPEGIIMP